MGPNRRTFSTAGISNTLRGSTSGMTADDMEELIGMIRSQIAVVPQPYPQRESHVPSGPFEGGGRSFNALATSLGVPNRERR